MKRSILTLAITMAMSLAVVAKDPKPCPGNYYANALNKSDQALLTALYSIITSHTNIGYDGLWDAYADTDTDPNGYYIDMYSNYDKYTYSNKCGNYSAIGDCINREHSVPKSWWGGSKVAQYSDIFNIVPTDGYVNNQRSNYPYGVCEGGTRLTNGQYVAKGRKGPSTYPGYSGTVFEPDDEYKGDFARAYFYMAACYNNIISNWTQSGGNVFFAGNNYPVFTTYAINLLIAWHRLDPVSEKETKRNDYAYAWQDNRNPFIDHPELAEHIWGNMQGQPWTGDGTVVVTPILTQPASGTTIDVGTISSTATSVSKQVIVKGSNLTESLSLTTSGEGFSVSSAQLTANAVNDGTTVTVTYSGEAESALGYLTLSSSEVSSTVTLTARKQSTTPVDPTPSGESNIETWEGCAQDNGNYATKTVQGAAYQWHFVNAGIFNQDGDHWIDEVACRFGKSSTSSITMLEDVAGTSGISFYAAYWKNDGAATFKVLYSTDGGNNWTQLAETTVTTNSLQQFTYGLNITGNVRFMFQQTSGTRLNFDNIAIYAPIVEPTEPRLYFDGAIAPLTATLNSESSISEVTIMSEDNEEAISITVDDDFELSLDQQNWSQALTLDPSGETFYVRLASTAEMGEYQGTITATAGVAAAYADISGEVTAPAVTPGDVNMDGKVNVSDVTALIAFILGNEVTPFNVMAANLNGDNDINVADVTALISMILNSGSATAWKSLPAPGGIYIDNPLGEMLEVYDLNANLVASTANSGNIDLPSGIYLVTGDSRSRKVVVK